MCMSFAIRRREIAAFVAFCVVASPVLIPVGLLAGAGYGIKRGVSHIAHHGDRRRSQLHWLRRQSSHTAFGETFAERILTPALQFRDRFPKDFRTTFEVAMCLFLYQDFSGAGKFFQEAISYTQGVDTPIENQQRAIAQYFLGLNCQMTRQFIDAKQHFIDAARSFELGEQATGKDISQAEYWRESEKSNDILLKNTVDKSQCLVLAAYALYLQAIYAGKTTSDSAVAASVTTTREAQLKEALALLDKADSGRQPDSRSSQTRALIEFRLGVEPMQQKVDRGETPSPLAGADVNETFLLAALEHLGEAQRTLIEEFDVSMFGDDAASVDPAELRAGLDAAQADLLCLTVVINAARGMPLAVLQEQSAEALRLDPFSPIGSTIFGTAGDQQQQEGGTTNYTAEDVLCRFPLPSSVALEEEDAPERHDFEQVRVHKPTWCDHCLKFITPIDVAKKRVLRCKRCDYECHEEKCGDVVKESFCMNGHRLEDRRKKLAASSEPSSPSSAPPKEHRHLFYPRRIHRPHMCDGCDKFIMMMKTALQCNQCNAYCHRECFTKMGSSAEIASVEKP